MPTYEYECKTCGHTFEAFQSMSDAPLRECPACGKEVRRLINGGAGVIFKGSGFYVNDSRSGKSGSTKHSGADSQAKASKPNDQSAAPAASDAAPKAKEPAAGASGAKAGAGDSA